MKRSFVVMRETCTAESENCTLLSASMDDELDKILDSALEEYKDLERANAANTANAQTAPQDPFDFTRLTETIDRLAGQNPQESDDLLNGLFKEFDEQSGGYQGMIQGMMKQLLAKEVLYDPLKEMYEKYPKWLEENKGKVDEAEYKKYLQQYSYIDQIIFLYESKGDTSFEEILKLMRLNCGQVPIEIVKQLAPELQVGPDGQPKFPGLEALDSLPTGDDCNIM